MTNINCALNCIYQKEGKCCYENVDKSAFSSNPLCAYYREKSCN